MDSIGDRIKYLRNKYKITQQQLAESTNISRGNLSNYENGRFKPASDVIIAISKFFHITTDWLLTGEEPKGESKDENNLGKLSDEEMHFIELLRNLDDKEKNKIEGMLELKVAEAQLNKKATSPVYPNGEDGSGEDAADEEKLA